jgi:hypothetical protein
MFGHLYKTPLTLKTKTGTNEYSDPTFSDSTIYCRINWKNRLIKNSRGEDVTASALIITDSSVSIGDFVTYSGRDYEVIQSDPIYDFDGDIDHYEAFI